MTVYFDEIFGNNLDAIDTMEHIIDCEIEANEDGYKKYFSSIHPHRTYEYLDDNGNPYENLYRTFLKAYEDLESRVTVFNNKDELQYAFIGFLDSTNDDIDNELYSDYLRRTDIDNFNIQFNDWIIEQKKLGDMKQIKGKFLLINF
jgi:hypothetical protein